MNLIHKNCGGEVREDLKTKPYYYDSNNPDKDVTGNPDYMIPAYRCTKCHKEILGDSELEDYEL